MKLGPNKFELSFRGENFTLQCEVAKICLSFDDPASPIYLSVSLECSPFEVSLGDDLSHTYYPAFTVEKLTVPSADNMPWQRRIAGQYAYSDSDDFDDDQTPGYLRFNHNQSIDCLSMGIEWNGKEFQLSASGTAEMDTTFQLSVSAVVSVEIEISPERMAVLGGPVFSDKELADSHKREQYWLASPDCPQALISEFSSHFDPNDFEMVLAQNTNHKWWRLSATPRVQA